MIRIEPYKMWSGGARALGIRAGILRATSKQVAKHGSFGTIINWGNSDRRFHNATYINTPEAVSLATDKVEAARCFERSGCPAPRFTTTKQTAERWFSGGEDAAKLDESNDADDSPQSEDSGSVGAVLCRTLTRASGGRGIVIAESAEELVKAPLYVEYIKKVDEYRVHVVDGQVIDIQQKKKRQEVPNEEVNYQIRNASNGWVYCRGGVSAPSCIEDAARVAVECLGLSFGAVDIGYNAKSDSATVYEVNTAPGLEGTTLDNYYAAFQRMLPVLKGGAYARRRSLGREIRGRVRNRRRARTNRIPNGAI